MNPNKLNAEQQEAVDTIEGALLVLAGAGSGKTRVVTYRIVNLLNHNIDPTQILGLTFTNKAADEMKTRIRELTQSNVLICTFHSLGVRILRESIETLGYKRNFTIYDEDDVLKIIKTVIRDLNLEETKGDVEKFQRLISKAKNELINPENVEEEEWGKKERHFSLVYAFYQRKLKEYGAVDFDDLLFLPVRLFREHPAVLEHYQNRWSFLLIDEYQDTNQAQYTIVRHLVAKSRNLFAVGDPDQAIYSWRGANIKNILNFESDFPGAKIIRLEQNYRSQTNILDAASALISLNDNRYKKQLWSDLGQGEKIKLYTAENDKAEAGFIAERIFHYYRNKEIPLSEMAIFYRTNFQSRVFEDAMISKRLPYLIVGGLSFYRRREIKDILAFLRMVESGSDLASFLRTINIPKRGIGDTTIEKIRIGAMKENVSVLGYCEALVDHPEMLQNPIKLSVKQREGLQDYTQIMRSLKKIRKECNLTVLVEATIAHTRYLDYLKEDEETFIERKENIDDLVSKSFEWESTTANPSLTSFLEELSLKSSLDESDTAQDRINLMTIHNGKGLEFAVTFLVGMEENLFPHINSRGNESALEEERRLCYVGITRAKRFLYMTNARTRFMRGTVLSQIPSRFIKEIPVEYTEKIKTTPGAFKAHSQSRFKG